MNAKTVKRNVREHLMAQYGKVQDDWEVVIELLGDNITLYDKVMKSIDENGIYDVNKGLKNPLLSTAKDLQATILKEVQHLGISPYALSKIRKESEDDSDDFLEALVGE